ncbi:D-alanyl-D-alanine carboxypeptidase/D-alanyl-D-alanine-endopeptidase [Muricauda sp. MAR_2010_75]|jgi:D-alanyl-D-alanine carboxypeptidase/D-alanyl-D-alanine-endopeptidase (penicillin-binding protein 4)|uniref:D-alanyl-D-alanine carboxypeptidase/D-alanyl-D-alanine-endopeptidase n=1 Tax=Allomuricauda sp. MAR_2010_75 TaxID=1250232 RepID=UPI000561A98D|nr:D-alanyl-D-alanine carboxypeptidase [Muricauda sp. MAR_2010_75]
MVIAGLFLLFGCSSVRTTLNNQIQNEALKNSFHGLVVMDVKAKKTVFEHNGDRYFTPASNTKIATFYTSARLLPKNIPTLKYGVYNDTLYIEGTGDPSWFHPRLADSTAIQWLKKQGSLAVFTKNSKESRFGPGWAWEDYDAYFSPEKSTLPLFGNVVTLSNVNGKSVSPQYFTDKVEIKDTTLRRDELQNHFYISPTEQDTLEIPFITNDSLTKDLLENVLRTKVVLTDHFPNVEKRTLYGMETDSIYKDMLFESDNFLAEQLLMVASSTLSDTLSTKKTIDYMLENDLSDLEQPPRWVDGSGLSRYNLFTPMSFVQILQKLFDEMPEERLFAIFPMWDASGTVKAWSDPTIEPFIFAKSGSLGNTYNLSGYLKTKSGKWLIFSFMNNHFKVPSSDIRNTIYSTLKTLYNSY